MAAWPTGVAVVTSAADGRPVGCTVTAVASVSADPPLLLVSLATKSRTLAAIARTGRFALCVLSTAQRDLARTFATGDPVGRFAGVPFDWVFGVPVLRAATAGAVCAIHSRLPVADHVLVVGAPAWHVPDPSGAPVIWYQRGLWKLCDPS
ncbi:flavin reductase family protein [Actinomycetes bacterium KLBMP 9797]